MYILPGNHYRAPEKGCGEKVRTYLTMGELGLPVLNSVIISNEEVKQLRKTDCRRIELQLKGKETMLRYIYNQSCHNVKNGGKIVEISRDSLARETVAGADLWLLEASRREDNLYCCNVCVDKEQQNMHMEILGKGFDISDINKGELCPHEVINLPYPIHYGVYGDWWKWAEFHLCTQKEYEESVAIRRERLSKLGTKGTPKFYDSFRPVGMEFAQRIFEIIRQIESHGMWSCMKFYNVSCSIEQSGRTICWDIQTPGGKVEAYG